MKYIGIQRLISIFLYTLQLTTFRHREKPKTILKRHLSDLIVTFLL
jgi:hypothetical protein